MSELHAPEFAMLAAWVEAEATYRLVADISIRNKVILSREKFCNGVYRVMIDCDGLRALVSRGRPVQILAFGDPKLQLHDLIKV